MGDFQLIGLIGHSRSASGYASCVTRREVGGPSVLQFSDHNTGPDMVVYKLWTMMYTKVYIITYNVVHS